MGLESPKKYLPEEITEMEKKRERVDKLRETDGLNGSDKEEDLVHNLAKEEDNFRELLLGKDAKKRKRIKELVDINKLADVHSDALLANKELRKESLEDSLTGLFNRRAFNRDIKRIVNLELREKKDCVLIILDLDFFKKVNDEYGHLAGDEVLKKVSSVLKRRVRKTDFIYRWGGEEFAVVCPNANAKSASIIAENIRRAVEEEIILLSNKEEGETVYKQTVSIGFMSLCSTDEFKLKKREAEIDKNIDIEKIINEMTAKADIALYASKSLGRNRVTGYFKES